MKFGYTIVYVEDVVQTSDFYQKAFGLKRKFLDESNQYAEMETGATTLAFCSETLAKSHVENFNPNSAHKIPSGFEIALTTEDVHQAFKTALDAGAEKLLDPTQKPWGQVIAYVRDNNGVLVEICSPVV